MALSKTYSKKNILLKRFGTIHLKILNTGYFILAYASKLSASVTIVLCNVPNVAL